MYICCYRWVGILFTILIVFISWITDNPPNSIHWLYIVKMVRQPIIPIFAIIIMSLSVSSLFLQLAFRLYLNYNVNNDFNAESNDIFQTKTLVIMLLFYVIAPLFRRLSQKLETPYGNHTYLYHFDSSEYKDLFEFQISKTIKIISNYQEVIFWRNPSWSDYIKNCLTKLQVINLV